MLLKSVTAVAVMAVVLPLALVGGLNIGDFPIKLPIAKVYSLPIFHLIQYIVIRLWYA